MAKGSRPLLERLKDWRARTWEMELLLSGFVLVFLLKTPSLIHEGIVQFSDWSDTEYIRTPVFILGEMLYLGSHIMIFNLIIHLFLRGLWIGVVGLDSIDSSSKRPYYSKFSQPFRKFLQKRVIGEKKLSVILDNSSSIVFSLGFLILFFILSLGFYFVVFILLIYTLVFLDPIEFLFPLITLLYFIGGVLYAIDFFGVGILKKRRRKWWNAIYYPTYRFFGWVTFSFLYRSLYYNLLSVVPRRTFGIILLLYLIGAFSVSSFSEQINRSFHDGNYGLTQYTTNVNWYFDELPEDQKIMNKASLESFRVKDYQGIYIPYRAVIDPEKDNAWKKEKIKDQRSASKKGKKEEKRVDISIGTSGPEESRARSILKFEKRIDQFQNRIVVELDGRKSKDLGISLLQLPNKEQTVFYTEFPVKDLSPGKHVLTIKRVKDEDTYGWTRPIPFYKR